ncbi:MAG: hypothetical protein ACK4QP_05440 [Pseudorhizobium sp.]
MGAAAVNAIIAPWFVRARPVALSMAYNGASVGGVIFSPLWVMLIASSGFAQAAVIVGISISSPWPPCLLWHFPNLPMVSGNFQTEHGQTTGCPRRPRRSLNPWYALRGGATADS